MHRQPVGYRASLARAAHIVWIVGKARATGCIPAGGEPVVKRDELLVRQRALWDVRLQEELAARLQQARNLVENGTAHEEPLVVTPLPPGVGEVDDDTSHTAVRSQSRESGAGVFREHTRPCAEAATCQPTIDHHGPLAADLEPHKHGSWLRHRAIDQEPAAP